MKEPIQTRDERVRYGEESTDFEGGNSISYFELVFGILFEVVGEQAGGGSERERSRIS